MAPHAYATPAGTLTLTGTAKGLEVCGPGGRVVLSNCMLAHLAEFSVTMLDMLQPDPDCEPNGDELDGCYGSEDEFQLHSTIIQAAGCPIADAGGCEDDGSEPDYAP